MNILGTCKIWNYKKVIKQRHGRRMSSVKLGVGNGSLPDRTPYEKLESSVVAAATIQMFIPPLSCLVWWEGQFFGN